jgi:GDP-L-fucose synthase
MAGPSKDARIFVAGHAGMVGSALIRRLQAGGYPNLVTRSRTELDLLDRSAVLAFMADARPDYTIIAAARVGGIQANNTARADFLFENLLIAANLIDATHRASLQRLLFLGSSCIYPRDCPQPIREEYLLSGPLEETNEPYAIAKIAGLKLCESYNRQHGRQYVSVMPTNLYGPNDGYDLKTGHVLPALLRKAHEAKLAGSPTMTLWGTGTPRREFMHVDDLADACVFLMERDYAGPMVNVGVGEDITVTDLAREIMGVVGYHGDLAFDASKPDGTPRKVLDVSRLARAGWTAKIGLREGLERTYAGFLRTQPPRDG